ncbi:MAG TPA: tyrosine-protein phosphatase [Anaerolineae bacterium]|jgi:protein-tyrosine phosphatase
MNQQRKLNFPDTANARDLGGYPTLDGQVTRWGSFVRADSTSRLTPEGIQAVTQYGIRTIVDLRFPHEKEQNPSVFEHANHGTRYVFKSLLGESWEHFIAQGGAFDDSFWYGSFLDVAQAAISHILTLMADTPRGGVLYHCAAGKDRTGVMSMLLLANAGVSAEVIAQDYAMSGIYLREECALTVDQTADPAEKLRVFESYSCPPEYALGTLKHLDCRYGSVRQYMRKIGLSDAQITRLREKLV